MSNRKGLADKSQRHDAAYVRAKQENYAARAVYKLEEIDKRFHLLRQGARVLDLGCWPGSWMQYAADRVGETGYVLGIDLRPVALSFPANVAHQFADVFDWTPPPELPPPPEKPPLLLLPPDDQLELPPLVDTAKPPMCVAPCSIISSTVCSTPLTAPSGRSVLVNRLRP